MQPQVRTRRLPARGAAAAFRICRNDEAFEAAPAPPIRNSRRPLSMASTRALATGFRITPNNPQAPREIPLPQRVAARAFQRREDDLVDLGPLAQPASDGQRALGMALEADTRACAGRAAPESNRRCSRRYPCPSTCRCSPGNVCALQVTSPTRTSECPPKYLVPACIEMSAPRAKAGNPSGVAQVLSSSTSAPWRCATSAIAGRSCTSKESDPGDSVNTIRVFGRNSLSIAAPAERIVVAHLDPETLELLLAEAPRRTIHGVGDQQVIAGPRRREQCERDRGQARGNRQGGMSALERRHRGLQIEHGRQARAVRR